MAGLSLDTFGGNRAGSNIDPDLQTIYQGGENFLSRVAVLQKTKADADTSLAQLSLGMDAKSAWADAKAKQEAATSALADANKKAADIVAQAQAKADALVTAAQTDHDRIMKDAAASASEAAQKLTDANAMAASARTELTNAKSVAQNAQPQIDAKLADMDKRSKALDAAKLIAEQAKNKHDALAQALSDKISSLHSAIQQVTQTPIPGG